MKEDQMVFYERSRPASLLEEQHSIEKVLSYIEFRSYARIGQISLFLIRSYFFFFMGEDLLPRLFDPKHRTAVSINFHMLPILYLSIRWRRIFFGLFIRVKFTGKRVFFAKKKILDHNQGYNTYS